MHLGSSSKLIEGSGGIFEVEYKGVNVFSKKSLNRFPEDGEVSAIVTLMDSGVDLAEAQRQVRENIAEPPSFAEWFTKLFKKRTT